MSASQRNRILIETRIALPEDLRRRNQNAGPPRLQTGVREIGRMAAQQRAAPRTIQAWLTHPDDRVLITLLIQPWAHRFRGLEDGPLGHAQVPETVRKAIDNLLQEGVVWSPLMDAYAHVKGSGTAKTEAALEETLRQRFPDGEEALLMLEAFHSPDFHRILARTIPEGFSHLEEVLDRLREPAEVLADREEASPNHLRRIEEWAVKRNVGYWDKEGEEVDRIRQVKATGILEELRVIYQKQHLSLGRESIDTLIKAVTTPDEADDVTHGAAHPIPRSPTWRALELIAPALTREDIDRLLDVDGGPQRLGRTIAQHTRASTAQILRMLRILWEKGEEVRARDVTKAMPTRNRREEAVVEVLLEEAPPAHAARHIADLPREKWPRLMERVLPHLDKIPLDVRNNLGHCLERWSEADPEHLRALVHAGVGHNTLLRLANHPRANTEVWHAVLDQAKSPDFRARFAKQDRPLQSPEILQRLARSQSSNLLTTLVSRVPEGAMPQVMAQIVRIDPNRALQCIEEDERLQAATEPDHLAPLLASEDARLRERAISALGRLSAKPSVQTADAGERPRNRLRHRP